MSSRIVARALCCALFSLVLGAFPGFAQFVPNRYTLLLEDAPVSSRFVSREAMRTSPAIAYRQQIEAKQRTVLGELASRNIPVTGSDATLVNAIFVIAPASRLDELKSIPGVAAVRPMRRFKASLNRATQLMNAPLAWNALGGAANAGMGMKIGIIDSGIDQTHPAFQDSTLTAPAGFPICSGSPDACSYTNSKVIVARSYVRQLAGFSSKDPVNLPDDTSVAPIPAYSMPDDYSPRDRLGHGTATASAAAANTNTGTVTFTGMAPKAWLGNYKLSGSPGVNDGPTDDVMILAVRDALKDGMDIVSLSWGSQALTGALDTGATCGIAAGQPCDPVAAAYEAAAKAGLLISVAAGNFGDDAYNYYNGYYPYYNSISSPATAPSVIGVGASTNSHLLTPGVSVNAANAPASVKGIPAQPSDATFYPSAYGSNQAPLFDVTQLGNNGLACTTLPANSLNGAYALIERGTCNFSVKASNAQLAGAVGVIFYMADSTATLMPTVGTFLGPVVMISNSAGVALKSYIDANPGQVVTIDTAGTETDVTTYVAQMDLAPAAANQLASYSSFGPTPDGAIKPDLLAVGGFDGSIAYSSGLYLAAQNYDPNGEMYSMNRYVAADGTSFATPIIAGAAALVKQAHPSYTSGQIKSALTNYAAQDTLTDDFGDAMNVLGLGAGRLDAGAASNATVTAEPATVSFGFVKAGVLPITRPITITNKGTASATLAVSVAQASPSTSAAAVAVDKTSLTLGAGGSATLNVSLSGSVPGAGAYSGMVVLTGSGVTMRLPYLFLVGSGVAANVVPVMGTLQGTPGEDSGAIGIQLTDANGVPVTGAAVSFAVSPRGGVTFQSVPGEPACSPNNSATSTACATDNYGIAYVEVILGATPGEPTITAGAAGTSLQFTAYILAQPAINAGGVVNAASSKGPVAPGSYVSIYGSNMVEADLLSNANGDGAAWLPLPMMIDAVNVSFDVPSAGISVPGNLIFVSPGQINVQVPWELEGQSSAQVKVTIDEEFGYPLFGNVVTVPLAAYAPAFYVGAGTIAAQDALTGAQILSGNPAHSGEILSLYADGLGPVTNQPASGSAAVASPLSQTTGAPPVVTIGGQQAQVLFSGLAPLFPSLYQLNVTVPAGLTGNQNVTVSIGGQTSPVVVLPVK
jgi:minor extracellular serine protease Vpr